MRHLQNTGSFALPNQTSRAAGGAGLVKSIMTRTVHTCLLFLVLSAPTSVLAQNDNTGTNPASFTYDVRFYSEMADLDDPGGSLLTNNFELRWPLGRNVANLRGDESGSLFRDMGKKFGARIRMRYKSLSLDNPGAGAFGSSEVSGISDFDARVLFMAYASKNLIIIPGLEATFNTATNSALGSGKTLLQPQIFAVIPAILGGTSLFAPGYQYVFDITGDGPDVRRSQIDLYFVWLLAKGKYWLIVDPQIILDHETKKEPALIEVEWGFMIAPAAGISTYVRPGVGIGSDKPYSWNFEAGLKFVWR